MAIDPKFHGSLVPLVTPFRNGRVDEQALGDLVAFHVAGGTHGLVPCGTTGESATLSHEEHARVVETVVEATAGHIPVIAGAGSNSTEEAIHLTRRAKEAGADATLHITPYYNKPTQEGLYRHFEAVAQAVDLPLIMYNVPGRTAVNLLPATVERLARIPNVAGIKEATANLDQISEILERCGEGFVVLSGDDMTVLPTLALGGKGVVSVTANVTPAEVAGLWSAYARGDLSEARRLHFRLQALNRAMFLETNPIPVKTALGLMGKCSPEMRLPLCEMGEANRQKLERILREYQLIP